jgi:hypothetical protein
MNEPKTKGVITRRRFFKRGLLVLVFYGLPLLIISTEFLNSGSGLHSIILAVLWLGGGNVLLFNVVPVRCGFCGERLTTLRDYHRLNGDLFGFHKGQEWRCRGCGRLVP